MLTSAQHISFYERLPFFLKEAEKLGFVRDSSQWSVIYYALENIDTLEQVKYTLTPLLAKTPEQQKAFYQFYDRWFEILQSDTSLKVKSLESQVDAKEEVFGSPDFSHTEKEYLENVRLKWWQWVLIVTTLTIIVLFIGKLNQGSGNNPITTSTNNNELKNKDSKALVDTISTSDRYYNKFKEILHFSIEPIQRFPIIFFIFFFVIFWFTWRLYLLKNLKIAVKQEHTNKSDTFWDFRLPHRLIAFGPEFKRLATRLRERISSQSVHLDIPKTVKNYIKSGEQLSPIYRFGTEQPGYLVLIDLSNNNNHRATLFDAFYLRLKDSEVPVARYFYRTVPQKLWNEENPNGVSLQSLSERFADSRLFVMGDGWRFLNPSTNKPDEHSKIFLSWKDRILITPISFPQWTSKERHLESLFVISPFTSEGLSVIEKHFNPEDSFDWELQRPDYWDEEAIIFDEKKIIESMRDFFPDLIMQEWLAALSFYPELNWNLTLFLGDLLSKKHQKALLTFENLRQISRIHWFYNGFIPEEAREKLYKILDAASAKGIHREISSLLEEQRKQKSSYISNEQNRLYLQILLHKALAGEATKSEIKDLRRRLKNEKQDFLTARFTKKPQPWEWVMSEEFSFLVYPKSELNFLWEKWLQLKNNLFVSKKRGTGTEGIQYSISKQEHKEEENPKIESYENKIFIIYRTSDTLFQSRQLQQSLDSYFGVGSVFYNNVGNDIGLSWNSIFEEKVRHAKVVLVLFNNVDNWLGIEKFGRRQIDDPSDRVRLEIENVLSLKKTVIPVLINEAQIPSQKALPKSIHPLFDFQACQLQEKFWDNDIKLLIDKIEKSLDDISIKDLGLLAPFKAIKKQTETPNNRTPLKVFIAYSGKDAMYMDQLVKYLKPIIDKRLISISHDRNIKPGEEWEKAIFSELHSSNLLLILVSADAVSSDFMYSMELSVARERGIHIIPIYVRPCAWRDLPFLSNLMGLPKNGVPISSYVNPDEAWAKVVDDLEEIIVTLPNPEIKETETWMPEMVRVEGGTFQFGKKHDNVIDLTSNQVTLSDFEIGKYPVTQREWVSIMGYNPSSFKNDNLPVEGVSWSDCQEFLNRLNEKTGQRFRLPTESEWEYAARGGKYSQGFKYSGSDDLDQVGWYAKNAGSISHPIGMKNANELGIFDMSGNVLEWCYDWYGAYPRTDQANPLGATSGTNRVCRGGGWFYVANIAQVDHRSYFSPVTRCPYVGFRLALSTKNENLTEAMHLKVGKWGLETYRLG